MQAYINSYIDLSYFRLLIDYLALSLNKSIIYALYANIYAAMLNY